jgi:superfamily II DNA or RNA helicase
MAGIASLVKGLGDQRVADSGISPAGAPCLVDYARRLCADRLSAYSVAAHDVDEHANIETSVLAGGYAYRQIAELVQNAADAIPEGRVDHGPGRIEVLADARGLWAANSGNPVDQPGVRALLNAHSSSKRGGQIGRFGLGFKSLLRLGGRIDVFSRSVCLRFDPGECRRRIREHVGLPPDAPAPGLRLAEAAQWADCLERADGARRFGWATTIVFAELLAPGAREAVTEELARFPAEFLLFLPCDVELVLESGEVRRHLARSTASDGSILIRDLASEKSVPQRWKVFQADVRIRDEAALQDATSVHSRESVPLIWAAPMGGQREVGRFFAFFPTSTESRTLGILNAPWKLNSDRTALITGAWNSALMEAAADLVAAHIGELATDDDPGAVLDAFPRELPTLADPAAPLVNALWNRLSEAPVLPNCDGELMRGSALGRAPVDSSEVIAAWSSLAQPEACEQHLHPSCTASAARTGRLNQLAERLAARAAAPPPLAGRRLPGAAPAAPPPALPLLRRTEAPEWLSLAASADPETAVEVLSLADLYARSVQGWVWDGLRDRLPLILTAAGELATAPNVVLDPAAEPPLRPVHPVVAEDPGARRILQERFRVGDAADTDWTRLLDAYLARAGQDGDWTAAWTLLRRMPGQEAREALEIRTVKVRTLAGWSNPALAVRLQAGFLPEIPDGLAEGPRRELELLVLDEEFHRGDAAMLSVLGLARGAGLDWFTLDMDDHRGSAAGAWHAGWLAKWTARYHEKLGYRPDRYLLRPDAFGMPRGWQLLLLLEGDARERLTAWYLAQLQQRPTSLLAPVNFRHSSRPNAWEAHAYPHPFWALLLERGVIGSGEGRLSFASLLCRDGLERAAGLPSLAPLGGALGQLAAAAGGWHSTRKDADSWPDWLDYASHEGVAPEMLLPFYARAAEAGIAPRAVSFPEGPVPLGEVRIARSGRDARLAVDAGIHAVAPDPKTAALWLGAGALDLSTGGGLVYEVEDGVAPELLSDVEPSFADVLSPQLRPAAHVLFVATLSQSIAGASHPVPWAVEDGRILVHAPTFLQMPWTERLGMLADAASALGWIDGAGALERMRSSGPAARRRRVAAEPDLPARLLAATGGPPPVAALFDPDVAGELRAAPADLARIAVTLFGPALLTRPSVREAMVAEGLDPPVRWGTEAAMEFVAAIGFPPEFASPPDRKREPELPVPGPLPLKPLHDFQDEVVDHLDRLFAENTARRRRAVVSLPTGAGKTRVVAEVAVTRVLAKDSPKRLVLWIAQSDELCEQAVQCFRELWPNRGIQGETLRLIRFWGGQTNPQPSAPGEPTVIVASIQTLTSRMVDSSLGWASDPGLLVIDECHHALTPSYTGALRWLNDDRESEDREPPIVGLSATPFRGLNSDETVQLARRFDGRLVPAGQASLFERLQARGVLARFVYTRLEMDGDFTLTADEIRSLETFRRLPESAMERLGRDAERNDRILEALRTSGERSALVFATSVAHARRLAARLNMLGITAAAVSGETDRSSRRWFVEAFRKGEVRVLCNHSALTTGFDAPATDLIVIARPVFSPSLYMQMVGRGLRGPLNGGKEHCRILTVQDNLDQYTGMLAHHYFEQHYVAGASPAGAH